MDTRLVPSERQLEEYQRFRITHNGVSPMSYPGIKKGQYQASGIAHSPIGYPTSKADLNEAMNEKRYKKLEQISRKYPLYNYYGQKGATLGLLGWGSTKGVIREAVHMCSRGGIDVCGLVPRILHPLPVHELDDWF
jgi:2-oxoglutarate ferredoxin oxidoreductase subunit alpha